MTALATHVGPAGGRVRAASAACDASPPPEKAAAKLAAQRQALRPRPDRAAGRRRHVRRGRPATPTPWRPGCRPTASSPGRASSTAGRPWSWPTTRPSRPARGARGRSRRSSASPSGRWREELPIFWLIDSAGARITDQVALFPGRRGAGRIFHNQVALSGKVPADLLPVRAVRGGRRLHPVVLRHRDHGRGQRLDVPRLAADGRDGRRREGHRWRRWAARGCTHGLRLRRQLSPSTTRTPSSRPGCSSPTCRRAGASSLRDVRGRARPSDALDRRVRARGRESVPSTCTRSSTAWSTPTRSSRSSRCSRPSSSSGFGPHRRPAGRHAWPTTRAVTRRRAVRRLARTRRPGSSGCATPSTSRCCTSPTCPAS